MRPSLIGRAHWLNSPHKTHLLAAGYWPILFRQWLSQITLAADVFGVELFIKGDDVWFSEVSPRPHDTGMVTLMSQNLSEFALHARAILGLPIPVIRQLGPTASAVLLVSGQSQQMVYHNIEQALAEPDTEIRLFGKPEIQGERRLGVGLAQAETVQAAVEKALRVIAAIEVEL